MVEMSDQEQVAAAPAPVIFNTLSYSEGVEKVAYRQPIINV
jgi:hypothetical protein